jgi:uncharacterized repeat protein (TIGR01451 family)
MREVAALLFLLELVPGALHAAANLVVTEVADPNPAITDCPFKFVISVQNIGDMPATSVQIIDTLPLDGNIHYQSCNNPDGPPGGCSYTILGGVWYIVTANLNDIAPGSTATVEIFVNPVNADFTKGAMAIYHDGTTMQYSGGPTYMFTVSNVYASASLNVDKPVYRSGETVVFRIDYSNTGTDLVKNLRIWDTIPAGSTFLLAEPVSTTLLTGGVVTWDIGDLAIGAAASVTLYSTAPVVCTCASPCRKHEVSGSYLSSCGYAYTSSIRSSKGYEILNGGLALTKTASGSVVPQGGQLTYYLSGVNPCSGTIMDLTVWDSLPPGTTFISTMGGGTIFGGSMVAWTENALKDFTEISGNYFSREFTVRVDTPGPVLGNNIAYGDFTNIAGFVQPRVASNPRGATVLNPFLTLSVTGPATVSGGETATFTLTVRNTGTDTAFGVGIVDTLPANFYAVSPAATGSVISWLIGRLDIGAEATVTMLIKSVRKDSVQVVANRAHAYCVNTNAIAQAMVPDMDVITLETSLKEPKVYPSPFIPSRAVGGTLKFTELPTGSVVTILNMSGKKIRTLKGVSRSRLEWDGKNEDGEEAAPGLYLYVIDVFGANGDKKSVKGRFGLAR